MDNSSGRIGVDEVTNVGINTREELQQTSSALRAWNINSIIKFFTR